MKKIAFILKQATDMVLPPRCIVSGELVERQGMLSSKIWLDLNFISAPYCTRCGMPFEFEVGQELECGDCLANQPAFDSARAALRYDEKSRDIILGFKHGDKTLAVKSFAPWLKRAAGERIDEADFILPVPLHRWRLIKRRYNQAALIALEFSKQTGIPAIPDGLLRVRHTPVQGHLKIKDREKNVRKAFAVNEKYMGALKQKSVILIDDVYTTGATVNECTKVLKKAGASAVHVLTVAKVVRG